jgi:hypothetical protein
MYDNNAASCSFEKREATSMSTADVAWCLCCDGGRQRLSVAPLPVGLLSKRNYFSSIEMNEMLEVMSRNHLGISENGAMRSSSPYWLRAAIVSADFTLLFQINASTAMWLVINSIARHRSDSNTITAQDYYLDGICPPS